MIRKHSFALIALSALLLGACAQMDAPLAMGPGSETSGFQVRLVNAKGEPSRKTEVKVVAVDGWNDLASSGSVVIARQTTDDSGRATFASSPTSRFALEAKLGSAVVRKEMTAGSGSSQTLVLRNGGMMLLRLKGDTVGIRKLLLSGTALEARRQSDAWVFPWVPMGSYSVVAWRDGILTPIARVVADSLHMLDTTLQMQATTFLDDFDTLSRQNLFGKILGGGYWFASGEGWQGGKSPISTPDLSSAHEPGWQGKSLHIQFQVDTTSSANHSMLNMDLGGGTDSGFGPLRNISTLDTATFMARGRGTIQFQLQGSTCTWSVAIVLPDAWTRIAIPASQLLPSGSNCTDWRSPIATVHGLGFRATRDAELWLDNLELKGVNPLHLFPELH